MAEPTEPKNNVIPHTGSRDMRDKRITGDKKTKEERQPVAATPREQIGRGTGEVKKPGSTSKYQFSEKVGGAFEKAGSIISGGSPLVSSGAKLVGKGVGAVADLAVTKEDTKEDTGEQQKKEWEWPKKLAEELPTTLGTAFGAMSKGSPLAVGIGAVLGKSLRFGIQKWKARDKDKGDDETSEEVSQPGDTAAPLEPEISLTQEGRQETDQGSLQEIAEGTERSDELLQEQTEVLLPDIHNAVLDLGELFNKQFDFDVATSKKERQDKKLQAARDRENTLESMRQQKLMAKNLGKFGLPGKGGRGGILNKPPGKGSSFFPDIIKNNIGKIAGLGIGGTALWKGGKGIVNLAKSALGMKVAPKVASTGVTAATSAAKAAGAADGGVWAAFKKASTPILKGASKLAVPLTIATEAFSAYKTETDDSLDRIDKNIAHTKSGGGLAGAAAGALMGQALIPIPVVGALIGGIGGYFLGSNVGETIAEEVAGRAGPWGSGPAIRAPDVSHEQVSDLSTEDKYALVKAAEKSGIIDVGYGEGDIDDYDKLATLDTDTLKAMLDMEAWKEEDETLIRNLINARTKGSDAITPIGDELISEESGILGSSVDATKRMLIPNMMIDIKEDEKQTLNDTLLKLVDLNETIQAIKGDGAAASTIVNNIYTDNSQGDTITDASSRSTQGGGSVAVPHPAYPAIGSSSAVGLVPTTSTAY